MRLNLLVLLFFFAMLTIKASAQSEADGPQVVQAYSAIYPAVAAAARASGSVIVEAEVDPSGKVMSARTVDGIRLLGAAAEKSARRWVFTPDDAKTRTVRLTFTFKLLPDDASADELLPIFLPPYQVEVRRALPKVTNTSNADPPLPTRRKH